MKFFSIIAVFSVFLLFTFNSFSQERRLYEVRERLNAKEVQKAKEAITLALENDKTKNKSETWYLKGIVYGEIAKDTVLSKQYSDAREVAFEAYKKAYQLDSNVFNKNLVLINQGIHPSLFIYNLYFQEAVQDFNTKNFMGAIKNFQAALRITDYLAEFPNLDRPVLDTSIILNIAVAADALSKNEQFKSYLDTSIKYYSILADVKLSGRQYEDIYKTLCYYYYQIHPDDLKLDKYLYIGKQLYPKSTFFYSIEVNRKFKKLESEKAPKEQVLSAYEEAINTLPNGQEKNDLERNYAAELFNYIHLSASLTSEKKAEMSEKLEEVYGQLLEKKTEDPDINLEMAKHFWNLFLNTKSVELAPINTKLNDLQNKKIFNARALKQAVSSKQKQQLLKDKQAIADELDKSQRRKDLINKIQQERADNIIEHSKYIFGQLESKREKGTLTRADKNNFKSVLNQLLDAYEYKKQQENVALAQYKEKNKNKAATVEFKQKTQAAAQLVKGYEEKIKAYEDLYDAMK